MFAGLICLALASSGLLAPWHGTAAAVMRTPSEIAIAADSRMVRSDNLTEVATVCKIRRFGETIVVGHNLVQDIATGFNLYEIARKAVHSRDKMAARAALFDSLVVPPLSRALERIRRYHPESFRRSFIGKAASGVIFAAYVDDVPVVMTRRYTVEDPDAESLTLAVASTECPGVGCLSGRAALFVGPDDAVRRYLAANPRYLRRNPADVVREFVEMRIQENGPDVGPPVDILRISRRGLEWLQKKSECDAD